MLVDALDVPCPVCMEPVGEQCCRLNGLGRVSFHKERIQAAIAAARAAKGMKPPLDRKKRPVKRFGAFLRLYGPKGAPTHALLVLGHGPEPDTPRGFLDELDTEYRIEGHAFTAGMGTEFRIHLNGRPRLRLPSYGASTRRVLNLIWQPGAAMPPLVCAGLKQMAPAQARVVADQLGQRAELCEHCGRFHVKGKRYGGTSRPIG